MIPLASNGIKQRTADQMERKSHERTKTVAPILKTIGRGIANALMDK